MENGYVMVSKLKHEKKYSHKHILEPRYLYVYNDLDHALERAKKFTAIYSTVYAVASISDGVVDFDVVYEV
jgi:hypothetical protein